MIPLTLKSKLYPHCSLSLPASMGEAPVVLSPQLTGTLTLMRPGQRLGRAGPCYPSHYPECPLPNVIRTMTTVFRNFWRPLHCFKPRSRVSITWSWGVHLLSSVFSGWSHAAKTLRMMTWRHVWCHDTPRAGPHYHHYPTFAADSRGSGPDCCDVQGEWEGERN